MSNAPIASFVRRHSCFSAGRGQRRAGFTLLELLIVIGIIALLISLLLPALARTREAARQALCLSHLQQVSSAIITYINDNEGAFPGRAGAFPAGGSAFAAASNDWIFWTPGTGPTSIQNIANGGIGPYLKLNYNDPTSLAVLRCPSDDPNARPMGGGMPYPFSFVINAWMSSSPSQPNTPAAQGQVRTLSQVKNAAQKVLLYEENSQTLNDGAGDLTPTAQTDLLAIRHDWMYHNSADGLTDNMSSIGGGAGQNGVPNVPYVSGKGNVVFCDGHGEFLSRQDAHSKAHYAPDPISPPFSASGTYSSLP